MQTKKLVCVVSSVHPANDPRIWEKQIPALIEAGYRVCWLHCDKYERRHGQRWFTLGLPRPHGRWRRAWLGNYRFLLVLRRLKPGILHIHDSELLPLGVLARIFGMRVVYDAHEHLPRQIAGKPWIFPLMRLPLSHLAGLLELALSHFVTGIVAATPDIQHRFERSAINVVVVRNFPILERFTANVPASQRKGVIYIGRISLDRGLPAMIELGKRLGAPVILVGRVDSQAASLLDIGIRDGGVDYRGALAARDIPEVLAKAAVGLCLLSAQPNYVTALPTKLFEYFAAGMPVVASDFPLWRDIMRESSAGVQVDPTDADAIYTAVSMLLADVKKRETLGKNGRAYVTRNANWTSEAVTLTSFYKTL